MPLLIRAEDVNGLLTMEEAIDAVEAGFREWGKSPEHGHCYMEGRRPESTAQTFSKREER